MRVHGEHLLAAYRVPPTRATLERLTYLPRPRWPIILLQGQQQVLKPAYKLGQQGQHGY